MIHPQQGLSTFVLLLYLPTTLLIELIIWWLKLQESPTADSHSSSPSFSHMVYIHARLVGYVIVPSLIIKFPDAYYVKPKSLIQKRKCK